MSELDSGVVDASVEAAEDADLREAHVFPDDEPLAVENTPEEHEALAQQDRTEALNKLYELLETAPESAFITVSVQDVALSDVPEGAELKIVEQGQPGAFMTADVRINDKIKVNLYVKGRSL